MKYGSIEEIFAANRRIREILLETVAGLSEDHAFNRSDESLWSAANIVEHISMVEEGSVRICTRLLTKAQNDNDAFDGRVKISDGFWEKAGEIVEVKLQAPDIVQPKGNQSIEQSLERMRETQKRLDELKPLFEKFDGSKRTFPHPFFGDLSAHEWLVLSGLHEQRHISQLKRIINTDQG